MEPSLGLFELFFQAFCNEIGVQVLATVASLLTIDRLGRRRVLLLGAGVMAVSLVLLATFALIQQQQSTDTAASTCREPSAAPLNATDAAATQSVSSLKQVSSSSLAIRWLVSRLIAGGAGRVWLIVELGVAIDGVGSAHVLRGRLLVRFRSCHVARPKVSPR